MEEVWKKIPEFPIYSVSNLGRVWNDRYGRELQTNPNNFGHMRVTLREGGIAHTVSVALLVAEAFVEPPDELSDHVILLDGDLRNVSAYNLAFRPRWFAWKYARQLRTEPYPQYRLQIYNITLDRWYPSVIDCGMDHGLLFADIWRSANRRNGGVYPYGWEFAEYAEYQNRV